MHIPKNYFHDRLVLLLLSINAFFVLLGSLLILLKLDGGRETTYIIQYRSNLGLSAYKSGGMSAFLGFVAFFVFIFAFHSILSAKMYTGHRQFAISVLLMGLLLLILGIIVSNALLVLR